MQRCYELPTAHTLRYAPGNVWAEGMHRLSETAGGEITVRPGADDAKEPGRAVKYGPRRPTPVGRPAGRKPAPAIPAMVSDFASSARHRAFTGNALFYLLGGDARRRGSDTGVSPSERQSTSGHDQEKYQHRV